MEFEVIWTDTDEMLQLGIKVSSRKNSAYHETYVYPDELAKFAGQLRGFPENAKSEVVFQCGSMDPKFHDFIRMRIFVLKSNGHSALELESDVRGIPPVCANVHFYVPGMPSDFNRLGTELGTWLKDPRDPLMVEWKNF